MCTFVRSVKLYETYNGGYTARLVSAEKRNELFKEFLKNGIPEGNRHYSLDYVNIYHNQGRYISSPLRRIVIDPFQEKIYFYCGESEVYSWDYSRTTLNPAVKKITVVEGR